jgi:hypothetical protein
MRETFRTEYPGWNMEGEAIAGDFETDVALETAS